MTPSAGQIRAVEVIDNVDASRGMCRMWLSAVFTNGLSLDHAAARNTDMRVLRIDIWVHNEQHERSGEVEVTKGTKSKQVSRKCNVCGKVQMITANRGFVPPTCAACSRKRSGFNSTGPRP